MNVTQVSLCETQASKEAGRPALTPELLAATGARYSRSNEGLEAILVKIDPENPDKSVDSIFRFLDYGHSSIADMSPVALFMDGISILLAYHLWALCPLAGGQESSSRYIRFDADGMLTPEEAGIPEEIAEEFLANRLNTFLAYEKAIKFWESVLTDNPELARIPSSLLSDSSDKSKLAVARMKRNYAFDRARVFLPVSSKTNVMMIQPARQWVYLAQNLLSMPLPEANQLGEQIREELNLVVPRLIKHAVPSDARKAGILQELKYNADYAVGHHGHITIAHFPEYHSYPHFKTLDPKVNESFNDGDFSAELFNHDNRYGYIGKSLSMISVHFKWEAVGFAEIRDLNRHRTGSKYCPLIPMGFHFAGDQLSDWASDEQHSQLAELIPTGVKCSYMALDRLRHSDWTYQYHCLLGTQFPFSHTTTADKFIYEAELRTGTGAHYKYAQHLRDILQLWYKHFPSTEGLIHEGSAEPE